MVHLLSAEERNDMDIAHLLVDKYLMFFYSSGGNYIHIELLDSRLETHVLNAYKRGIKFFSDKGLKPNVQRMDNEPSVHTKRRTTLHLTSFRRANTGATRRSEPSRQASTTKSLPWPEQTHPFQ
jgi:hypothetical protein